MINFKTFTGYHNVSKHKLTIDGSLFSSKIQVGRLIMHSKLQNQSLSLSGFFRIVVPFRKLGISKLCGKVREAAIATDITQTLWKNWVLFLLPKIFLNHKTQRWCANIKYLIFFTIKMSSSNFIMSNLLIFDDRMHMEYKCFPCSCKDIIQLVIKVKVNEILWVFS